MALSGCGGGDGPSTLSVTGAWARPTLASADNAIVYFSIVSPIDDEIVSVSVPRSVAAEAQLHESMEAGGAGAHHLAGPLVRGERFDLTITMKSAPPLVVSIPVQDNAP